MAINEHIEAWRQGKSVWQYRAERLGRDEPGEVTPAVTPAVAQVARHEPMEELRALQNNISYLPGIISASGYGQLAPRSGAMSAQVAVRDGYEAAGIVFVCIERIARACSSVPFQVQDRKRGDKWEPATSKEGRELAALIEKPNVSWPWNEYVWRLMQHLLLTGNALTRQTRYETRKGVAELWLLDPDGVTPKADKQNIIQHYRYAIVGQPTEVLSAEDVIHVQLPHPRNPHWGMSPLTAAARAVDLDVSAADWQTQTLKNQGRPSGMVTTSAKLGDDAYNQRREAIKTDIQGVDNAGKVLFMDGDSKFSSLSLTAEELAYLESRKFTREEICAIYAVPPPVAGYYDTATYNNVANARVIFWLQTVIPYLKIIAQNMNMALRPVYGNKVRVAPDLSGIEALAPMFKDRLILALHLKKLGYSLDIINERLDLGMPLIGEDP